jgi:hypothetical protein
VAFKQRTDAEINLPIDWKPKLSEILRSFASENLDEFDRECARFLPPAETADIKTQLIDSIG